MILLGHSFPPLPASAPRKKRKPLVWEPVMAFAAADRPARSSTVTCPYPALSARRHANPAATIPTKRAISAISEYAKPRRRSGVAGGKSYPQCGQTAAAASKAPPHL